MNVEVLGTYLARFENFFFFGIDRFSYLTDYCIPKSFLACVCENSAPLPGPLSYGRYNIPKKKKKSGLRPLGIIFPFSTSTTTLPPHHYYIY